MIIVLNPNITEKQIEHITQKIREHNLDIIIARGTERIVIGIIGDERTLDAKMIDALPGVEKSMRIVKQHKLVSREFHPENKIIDIKGIKIGGKQIQIIAGPCAVESPEQMEKAAQGVKHAGCRLMRGGAFKPRTSPYAFQGLGVEGLIHFKNAANPHQLPIVTELTDVRMLDNFLKHDVDVIQIGTRNMQNFDLLKEVGKIKKPVILKRGMSATISEWLLAAEYIATGGNSDIILCERGVRSFETAYRNMLDITAVLLLKKETHLPVIIDPSHSGGKVWLVPGLSQAAIAAGVDGLLIDVHPTPTEALCDADQALTPAELMQLMATLKPIAEAVGREI